ncbi:hypothetical protein BH11ACT4_BH11ACT4_16360 [soil metagenome]
MTDDLPLPTDPKKGPSMGRIAIWVIVSGVGLYLLVTGIIGIIVKGQ